MLIPFQLVWIVAVAAMQLLPVTDWTTSQRLLYFGGAALVVLAVLFLLDVLTRGSEVAESERAGSRETADTGDTDTTRISTGEIGAGTPFDPFAGGYPVPPLPGQSLPPVPARRGAPITSEEEPRA